MDTKRKRIYYEPPNGGWGWVIVAAVAITNVSKTMKSRKLFKFALQMFNASIPSVFGLLFGERLEFISPGTSMPAFLANCNSLMLNFSGLFIGPAIKNFSPKKLSSFAVILISTGLTLCGSASEIWQFVFGYCVMVGLGLGILSPSTFMIINSYFTTKKPIAVGITLAGTGIGQIVVPHIVSYLLDNFEFEFAVDRVSWLSLIGVSFLNKFRDYIEC